MNIRPNYRIFSVLLFLLLIFNIYASFTFDTFREGSILWALWMLWVLLGGTVFVLHRADKKAGSETSTDVSMIVRIFSSLFLAPISVFLAIYIVNTGADAGLYSSDAHFGLQGAVIVMYYLIFSFLASVIIIFRVLNKKISFVRIISGFLLSLVFNSLIHMFMSGYSL